MVAQALAKGDRSELAVEIMTELGVGKILEENKGNLKTESAYKKSRKAVDKLLNNIIPEESKIDFAIEYLLNQCEDITPLALQKALYYIQET